MQVRSVLACFVLLLQAYASEPCNPNHKFDQISLDEGEVWSWVPNRMTNKIAFDCLEGTQPEGWSLWIYIFSFNEWKDISHCLNSPRLTTSTCTFNLPKPSMYSLVWDNTENDPVDTNLRLEWSDSPLFGFYNRALARKMAAYAMAAYGEEPSKYLPRNGTFVEQFSVALELNGFKGYPPVRGYIAVDRMDQQVIVAFCGTNGSLQLYEEFETIDFTFIIPGGNYSRAPQYFVMAAEDIMDSYTTRYTTIMKSLSQKFPNYQVVFTGHSLGGSVASIVAFLDQDQWNEYSFTKQPMVYTFGEPRTGNKRFHEEFNKRIPLGFRIVNIEDPIPFYPSTTDDVENSPYRQGIQINYKFGNWYEEEGICIPELCADNRNVGYFGIATGVYAHQTYMGFHTNPSKNIDLLK